VIIKRAKTQGFCFGVAITVKKAEEAVDRLGAGVTTLGHVVHNPQMVAALEAKGLKNARHVDEVDTDTLFVRAHGLPVETLERAKERGITVIDATCPMVTKIHLQAEKLRAEGYKVVVVGDPDHPEVKGTLSHVPGAWCITKPEDVDALPRASRVGVVVQSTWNGPGFTEIVRKLSEKYYDVRAINTICTDTKNRQSEVEQLAREVEVMVVVGGKTSANTKHLAELAAGWFAGIETAGLMSGASTPGWLVDRVADRMDALAAGAR
jgi:4-hydroxy-3-methylbut-2-enyl diphosphate reductase